MTPKKLFLILLLSIVNTVIRAQPALQQHEKQWEGKLTTNSTFSLPVAITLKNNVSGTCTVKGQTSLQKTFSISKDGTVNITLPNDVRFIGKFNKTRSHLSGFMHAGQWQYHLNFIAGKNRQYFAKWNILLTPSVDPAFYLSVENVKDDQYEAYAFSGESGFSGFNCYDFNLVNGLMQFKDGRTGLTFTGKPGVNQIQLQIKMAGLPIGEVKLHPSATEWVLKKKHIASRQYIVPKKINDGLAVTHISNAGLKKAPLQQMVDSINAGKITNTQSVLIARNGKLIFEQYFDGFNANIPHDLRSAAKSISSALTGIAIDQKIFSDTSEKLYNLLPSRYQQLMEGDARKKAISIGSLLTMSSGLDAIDFGITRKSPGAEDNYQSTRDWAETVLKAPMIHAPGTHANYSSANPYLLGKALNFMVKEPLELYIDRNLFAPLRITNYIIQSDETDQPYFGGGMYLIPRDMLKFGLMYANNGIFNGKRILSAEWITASFKAYLKLENHNQKNDYGFLWWHYQYHVNGSVIKTIEARGAGGQYIFIVPQYRLVVVVTSANFRNGRVWQPEKILENYILPAIAQP